MSRWLNEEDLRNIVVGSSYFGGGGGGSAEEGLKLIEKMKEQQNPIKVEMVEVDDMEPGTVATMVACLGSPVATKGRLFIGEAVNAVVGMKDEAKRNGKNLKYVYSGEQGGGNTMLPIYAAWSLKMPILNTDGNGRAVPELNTGLEPIYGIPTSPVVLASNKGDTIVGRTADPLDSKGCEKIARYMCQAYDMGIGFAAWMMDQSQLEKATAVGHLDLTMGVGEIIRKTKNANEVSDKLAEFFKLHNVAYKPIVCGNIEAIEITCEGGFDTGKTTILEESQGKEYHLLFQNENLVAYEGNEKALATVPTIMSIIRIKDDGTCEAISNSETVVGDRVLITATAADRRWYEIEEGYGCWKDVLISAGYGRVNPEVRV